MLHACLHGWKFKGQPFQVVLTQGCLVDVLGCHVLKTRVLERRESGDCLCGACSDASKHAWYRIDKLSCLCSDKIFLRTKTSSLKTSGPSKQDNSDSS